MPVLVAVLACGSVLSAVDCFVLCCVESSSCTTNTGVTDLKARRSVTAER